MVEGRQCHSLLSACSSTASGRVSRIVGSATARSAAARACPGDVKRTASDATDVSRVGRICRSSSRVPSGAVTTAHHIRVTFSASSSRTQPSVGRCARHCFRSRLCDSGGSRAMRPVASEARPAWPFTTGRRALRGPGLGTGLPTSYCLRRRPVMDFCWIPRWPVRIARAIVSVRHSSSSLEFVDDGVTRLSERPAQRLRPLRQEPR